MGCKQTFLDVNRCESLKISIFATAWRYISEGVGCKLQVGHNDMPLNKSFSFGHFFILNGSEKESLYIGKGSIQFLFYANADKWKTADILKINAIKLSQFSMFVGHGYLQSTGAK